MAGMLLSLVMLAAACGAPRSGDGERAIGTADEAKQTLLSARLTDVRGGGSFTLQDFGGKVVIVMGIAVW